jgi:capsular exopolysaccharide synthesis family protein
MMTPIYQSTVTLLIESNKSKVVSIEDVYAGIGQGKEHFQTQSEIIKSKTVAALVVDKLNLTRNPEFDPRATQSFIESLMEALGIDNEEMTEDVARKIVIQRVMKKMTVEPVRLSELIKVSFDSPDRDLAAKIANGIADAYIENDMDARFVMTQNASNWLNSRLAGLKQSLEKSERNLQEYREREHIVDAKSLALSGASSQLESLIRSQVEAHMRRSEAESAYSQIKKAKGDLDSLPVVQRNPLVSRLKEVVADNERKVSELANRYGTEHVKMIQATAELKQAKENLRRQVSDVVNVLAREYEVARANEAALESAVNETKAMIQNSNSKEFELTSLEREVATNRQIYDLFLSRFKETSASSDMQNSVVARVVDRATPADSPAKPKKMQVILIALVLGLFLGVIVALLLEMLDNTIKTTEDAESKLGYPIIATIPLLDSKNAKIAGRHYLDEPKSIFSEGIRTARTGILLSAIDCPNKVIVVTSSIPGEGKSTFAINLALAHAQTKKVLLIDSDMRRPTISNILDIDPMKPGLSALVAGTADLQECVQTIPESSLDIISVGNIPPNPLELIISHKFKEMMAELSQQYDIIILDSPPVHLVSDAVVLSTMATGVIFVVKADSTPYQVARRSIRTLISADATLFGVAINQLDFKKADRFYGAYSGYQSSGYDGGYYAKQI